MKTERSAASQPNFDDWINGAEYWYTDNLHFNVLYLARIWEYEWGHDFDNFDDLKIFRKKYFSFKLHKIIENQGCKIK